MPDLDQLTVRGWDLLRLATETVQIDLVPALGGTITSLVRRSDDAELLWTTPWALRHRGSLSVPGNAQASMIDDFPGGWFSMFPNGGDSAVLHGAEWGVHGEARLTWLDWEFTGSSLILTGRLIRSPFEFRKVVSLRGSEVTVGETVTNVGGERIEMMWANQLMLGGALIGADTTVDAAASVVHPDPLISRGNDHHDILPWPRSYGAHSMINLRSVPGPDSDETRAAYLTEFSEGSMTVRRPSRSLGLELSWDLEAWPHAWYALEAGGSSGFPWFGKAYYLAVTPSTSWPGHGVHDARRIAGSTVWMAPGAALTTHLSAKVLSLD
ncbi:MAG TPA: hypothetical protein VIT20_04470 [Propionibacteriaceae bacterium]